jgi:hypothetical protein
MTANIVIAHRAITAPMACMLMMFSAMRLDMVIICSPWLFAALVAQSLFEPPSKQIELLFRVKQILARDDTQ